MFIKKKRNSKSITCDNVQRHKEAAQWNSKTKKEPMLKRYYE